MGQPVGMVRLMACRDTPTLRRSLFMIGFFYALIYIPLIVTFVCARALFPDQYLEQSDTIMPVMALGVTAEWPLLGGLILAAPVCRSHVGRGGLSAPHELQPGARYLPAEHQPPCVPAAGALGQLRHDGSGRRDRHLRALRPPTLLQQLIMFTGAGLAATFLAPCVLGLYWRGATRAGALAALLDRFRQRVAAIRLGWMGYGKVPGRGPASEPFAPLYLFGLDPVLYGLFSSFVVGILVSLFTRPLPAKLVDYYFLASPAENAEG